MADSPSTTNRWLIFVEILAIFFLFAWQGAWPTPDVNEAHYLGKAAHYWNPEWIRGDFFLDSADSHQVFYFTFGWLTLWLPLSDVAWTGRIITWLLMAWAWRRLSIAILSPSGAAASLSSSVHRATSQVAGNVDSHNSLPCDPSLLDKPAAAPTLIPRPGWSILTAALFVMFSERFQMAGEWFIGGVEAKGFAYVPMLLGLEAIVKNRWNHAWLLFGVSAAFHAVVGGWAVVMAGFAWLFLWKKSSPRHAPTEGWSCEGPGVRAESFENCPHPNPLPKGEGTSCPRLLSMLPGLLSGFLLSLPGLLPALALSRNVDTETVRQSNMIYVFERLSHHLDIFQFRTDYLCRFAFLTALFLVLCRMANKFAGKKSHERRSEETPEVRRRIRSICNLQFAITNLQSSSFEFMSILRLQAFVAGSLAIAFMGILIDLTSFYDRPLAAGLLRFYWFRPADITLPMGTAFILSFWMRQKLLADSTQEKKWGRIAFSVTVLLAAVHFGDFIIERIHPGPARSDINLIASSLMTKADQPSPSQAACLENLAAWQEACRWIAENTPLDARFFTPRLSQTFKWHARRAEVVTWKDVPQDAGSLVAWWDRIQEVFATGSPLPEFRWRENATEMEPERLKKLAKKYRAEYIIAPAGNPPHGWKLIYENTSYIVYRIDKVE